MAVKQGNFCGMNGHVYRVTLSGDTVTSGLLTLGVPPATISMAAGEHKFCGFKSATAVVNIITDVPLLELYSAGVTDIRLTIADVTDDRVEFDGYVTPFAFDQPYTGKNDSVTVNAVDLLTAHKGTPYTNVGDVHGVDISALTVVKEICRRVGVTRIVEHLSYNDSNDMMANASPLDVMVAQAGFLQDGMSDPDALSAICKFFGYTGHLVGDALYLYDEAVLVEGCTDATEYRFFNNTWRCYSHHYASERSPLRLQPIDSAGAVSVSVERAYDGIKVTADGSTTSVLLPNVCDKANEEKNTDGRGQSPVTVDGLTLTESEERLPLGSKLMELGHDSGEGLHPWETSAEVAGTGWKDGAMLIHATALTEKLGYVPVPVGQEPRYYNWDDRKDVGNVLWLRMSRLDKTRIGHQKDDTRYSHTGGLVELRLRYHLAEDDTKSLVGEYDGYDGNYIGFVQLKVGNQYFHEDYDPLKPAEWNSEMDSRLVINGLELVPTIDSVFFHATSFVEAVPNSGQIGIELGWDYRGAAIYGYGVVIEQLELVGYGEELWDEHPDLLHTYGDKRDELLEVSTILTTRKSGQDANPDNIIPAININARPSIVVGDDFAAGYVGLSKPTAMPLCGILMEQLKARYSMPRPCFKMTAEGLVNPFAAVEFNGQRFTVESYDKDLYNSTTTISID